MLNYHSLVLELNGPGCSTFPPWALKDAYQKPAEAKPGVLRLQVLDVDEVFPPAKDWQDDAQHPDGAELDVAARDQGLPVGFKNW